MLKIQRNHIDIWLLIVVLGLMVVSLGVVYSASAEWSFKRFETQSHYLDLHAIKILLSIGALFVGLSIPYNFYKKFTKPVLIIAVLFLVVTFVLGGETKGAVRWLRFGGLGFQPSEFAKFALLFHISLLLATKGESIRDFKKGFLPVTHLDWNCCRVGACSTQSQYGNDGLCVDSYLAFRRASKNNPSSRNDSRRFLYICSLCALYGIYIKASVSITAHYAFCAR